MTHDDEPLANRLPTILGGVLATLAIVVAGLWVSGRTGLPTPEAVLSMARPLGAPDRTGPVFAIGDSVIQGAKPCLKDTVITVNAQENRTIYEGVDLVERKAADGSLPPRLVVALGTNGPIGFKPLDRLMNAAGPERSVYWVTTELPDAVQYDYEDQVNQRLRAMPGRWPNAHIIDWNASVVPEGLYPDGIHLNPQGCRAYANLVLEGVDKA